MWGCIEVTCPVLYGCTIHCIFRKKVPIISPFLYKYPAWVTASSTWQFWKLTFLFLPHNILVLRFLAHHFLFFPCTLRRCHKHDVFMFPLWCVYIFASITRYHKRKPLTWTLNRKVIKEQHRLSFRLFLLLWTTNLDILLTGISSSGELDNFLQGLKIKSHAKTVKWFCSAFSLCADVEFRLWLFCCFLILGTMHSWII